VGLAGWLRVLLTGVLALVVLIHLARLCRAARGRRLAAIGTDLFHVGMGVAMAAMLLGLTATAGMWWAAGFAVPAIWFGWLGLDRYVVAGVLAGAHHLRLAAGAAAMCWMLVAGALMPMRADGGVVIAGAAPLPLGLVSAATRAGAGVVADVAAVPAAPVGGPGGAMPGMGHSVGAAAVDPVTAHGVLQLVTVLFLLAALVLAAHSSLLIARPALGAIAPRARTGGRSGRSTSGTAGRAAIPGPPSAPPDESMSWHGCQLAMNAIAVLMLALII
jgi:hypothetical protein